MTIEPKNLTDGDLKRLACPVCHGALKFDGLTHARNGVASLASGNLVCAQCPRDFALWGGVPDLVDGGSVSRRDSVLRAIYDFVAPSHDLGVNVVLPLIQFPDFNGLSRDPYVRAMRLEELDDPGLDSTGQPTPVRILEVGIGAGANIPLILSHTPMDLPVEIWGVDLSWGMLFQCTVRNRLCRPATTVKLAAADAHRLPFVDGVFDRVLHVGGINAYGDVRQALSEMARVAKDDVPIVVVDEALQDDRCHTPWHRLSFAALTLFDARTTPPGPELLPKLAHDRVVSWVSRFYYCLSFRVTKSGAPAAPSPEGPDGGGTPGGQEGDGPAPGVSPASSGTPNSTAPQQSSEAGEPMARKSTAARKRGGRRTRGAAPQRRAAAKRKDG